MKERDRENLEIHTDRESEISEMSFDPKKFKPKALRHIVRSWIFSPQEDGIEILLKYNKRAFSRSWEDLQEGRFIGKRREFLDIMVGYMQNANSVTIKQNGVRFKEFAQKPQSDQSTI